jgi:hypothetical protein
MELNYFKLGSLCAISTLSFLSIEKFEQKLQIFFR